MTLLDFRFKKKIDLLQASIESERLLQVPITLDYSWDIFKHFTKEITRFMYPRPPVDLKQTEIFVGYSIDDLKRGTGLQLVILDKRSREFLGCSGLHNIKSKIPELGIWLKKEAHHHGYGLEAIDAIVEWARTHIRFQALKYPVDKGNAASRRIPELLNGVPVKEYKKINLSGYELDEIEYWIYR